MGLGDSLSKGWTFIKHALAMAKHGRLLVPSMLQVTTILIYYAVWLVVLITKAPQWSDVTWGIVGAVAMFGSLLISYFFCGVTVNMVDVHLRGGEPSLRDGLADARKNLLAIIYLSLVSTIIGTLTSMARDSNSLIGKIVGGIVDAIWTTLTFLLLPTIIIEDAGFGDALRRVRELHSGHKLLVAVGEVGVRAILMLFGFVVSLVLFGAIFFAVTHRSTGAIIVALVFGAVVLTAFQAFSTFVRMAYYTCLYHYAAAVERDGTTAAPPAPLAAALGR